MGALQGRLLSAFLEIRGLTVRYGATAALDGLSLDIHRGELFVLLGGSGSGKTTLLRAIGGFVRPDAGAIVLDGVDIVPLPPHKRPVNTVFQSGALFPHMSVAANIGFGPRQRGMGRAAVAARVEELLRLVRLEGFGARRPHRLSGGQQQRVALARGLAASPALLLLDEPLSALDRGLRAGMAAELVALQKQLGTAFVLVTHDQREALTMAGRIGVMRDGRLAQIGAPREIFDAPADRFVAAFMGVANLWDGVVRADGLFADIPTLSATVALPRATRPGPATIGVRQERLQFGATHGENVLRGRLAHAAYAGETVAYRLIAPGGGAIEIVAPAHAAAPPENEFAVSFPLSACLVLPA